MASAERQLETFLRKYDPAIAAEAKKSLAKLRKLVPNAIEMVYDNYNALVVGFCPGMRPSEAILSIAVMPRWVTLCFLQARSGESARRKRKRCSPPQDAEWCSDFGRPVYSHADSRSANSSKGPDSCRTETAAHHQIHFREAAAAAAEPWKIFSQEVTTHSQAILRPVDEGLRPEHAEVLKQSFILFGNLRSQRERLCCGF
jgi:hypothetical protein